uniref:lactate/malate family dehydrogenase n=1 Tax=Salmonella sp. s57379 TaxID=3159694 RepID=UPI00398071FA
GVVATTNVDEACKDVNIVVMVGGVPCKEGMLRKDVLPKNVSIYRTHASALSQHAAPNCKVLVVANPANTNAHHTSTETSTTITETNQTSTQLA